MQKSINAEVIIECQRTMFSPEDIAEKQNALRKMFC